MPHLVGKVGIHVKNNANNVKFGILVISWSPVLCWNMVNVYGLINMAFQVRKVGKIVKWENNAYYV